MRLTNIRPVGRYVNVETGKECNIKRGRNLQRGTDVLFYLYRNTRHFISDLEFSTIYKKVTE